MNTPSEPAAMPCPTDWDVEVETWGRPLAALRWIVTRFRPSTYCRPVAEAASVHDTLIIQGRAWTVTGVFLGGLNQESVLGLQVDGERHDATAYGKDLPELFVPEIMVRLLVNAGLATVHKAQS